MKNKIKLPWPLAVVLLAIRLAGAAEPDVRVTLVIPPAEVHVVGDSTPLLFRFENRSATPLAFMWEGCCRFNGKLSATRGGREVPPTPPGQALAHMFAKAERLDPGQPKDFDTRLSDWVTITETGEYELRGRYQGVLPFQKPQVPRGLELWRGTAETPPLSVKVTSVADYLGQRADRSARRGLQLGLTGPDRLTPTQPAKFTLFIKNRASTTQRVVWPDAMQWWVVDAKGARVSSVAGIEAPREELALAPDATVVREVSLDAGIQEEAWGRYRAFIDLAGGGDQPRVPSSVTTFRWELTETDIARLVADAAAGHRTGARNSALKLLRTHLAAIAPALAGLKLEALTPAAATLASQLRLAACLRPHWPKPGVAVVDAAVAESGDWRIEPAHVADCLGRNLPVEVQFASLLAARRHLGWEIVVQVKPQPSAPLAAVGRSVSTLLASRAELNTEPRAVIPIGTNRVTTIDFPPQPTPANLVVRVSPGRLEFTRRLPEAQNPARNLIAPEELVTEQFQTGADSLERLLGDGLLASPRTLVLVSGRLTWGELLARLDALIQRGLALDVVFAE